MHALVIAGLAAVLGSPTKIAVMPMNGERLSPDVVKILNEILLDEVASAGSFEVVGASDIQAILGFEKMKDVLMCDDATCATEIGGALGAEWILATQVGVLGDDLVISGKLVDAKKSQVLDRATVHAKNAENAYAGALRDYARKLLAGKSTAAANLDRFLEAGLTPDDYDDFLKAGVPYKSWAATRNEESIWLELGKWGGVFMTAMGLIFVGQKETRNFGLAFGAMYGLATGGLFYLDAKDIDRVPDEM